MKMILLGIVAVVIVATVIFLYPKDAGGTCGFCPESGIHRTEYGCIGFRYDNIGLGMDEGTTIKCIGIVTGDKKCFGVPLVSNSTQDVEMTCY